MQFNDYKKKLDNFFVKKKKTPDFNGPYEKIKDHWEAFVKYKTSERAKTRSDTNKKNAANKMYFHTMGRGGYNAGRPKWEKWENDLIAKGIEPELFNQDALDKSLLSVYCLMKIRECRKGKIYDLGFVDPYTVNGFHYILLVIEPDTGEVEVMDSKSKPLEAWGDMADILHKAWKRFATKSPGLQNKELRIKHVPSLPRQRFSENSRGEASRPRGNDTKTLPRHNPFAPVRITSRCKRSPPDAPQMATWCPL
ncbi:hypothetical protein QYE76_047345 [Lolium multiflorum]|uniref:Ubiquitin-like protease family profile domain-containing protein n=1 Tax=Lolium multiflorum TaxID=4521 RepID=A0AAD8TRI7_LOLMU|nr:hypothetical protein QYE76_047345 [Lolium multiflorum]